MVRTGDSHSPNRGSIPLTADNKSPLLRAFLLSGIEPAITFVMWGSPLSRNVTFSHFSLGRVLTADNKSPLLRTFLLSGIEPAITFVMWDSPLSRNVTFSHLSLGRVLTAGYFLCIKSNQKNFRYSGL